MRTMRPSWPSSRSASAAFAPAWPAPTITWAVGSGMTGPSGERQELLTCSMVIAHEAVKRRGHGPRARLRRPAQRHAHVFGLQHHADAARGELAREPAGDLRGQSLLHLQV